MDLRLYKILVFTTSESKSQFLRRVEAHTVRSSTFSFFSRDVADQYPIKSYVRENEIVIEHRDFFFSHRRKSDVRIEVTTEKQDMGTLITVKIRVSVIHLVSMAMFLTFIVCVTELLWIIPVFALFFYTVTKLGLDEEVKWTEDLFKRKLLKPEFSEWVT